MQKVSARTLAITGVIAALYAVLTVALSPFSFGAVQFRFSEALLVLALVDRRTIPGLILGCAIANLFSPMGLWDVAIGTSATALALWAMTRTKNPFGAMVWPAVMNGLLVGWELWFLDSLPFWLSAATVAAGELGVLWAVGYPFYRVIRKQAVKLMG